MKPFEYHDSQLEMYIRNMGIYSSLLSPQYFYVIGMLFSQYFYVVFFSHTFKRAEVAGRNKEEKKMMSVCGQFM